MEICHSFDELFQNAFDFWEGKFDSFLKESCEVVVHVFEDEEGGSLVKIAAIGSRNDDLLEFNDIGVINLFQQ